MKILKAVFAVSISIFSTLALAEGGGDRVYGRMMQENQQAMEQYALKTGKTKPEIVHYEYGMNLDILKVVSVTQANKTCNVAPSRMTYEDSAGRLHTLEYRALGTNCPHGS